MKIKFGHAGILGFLLISIGLGVFFLKAVTLHYPIVPEASQTVWDLEIYLEFEGRNVPARIETYIPASDVDRTFPTEQFYNGAFGLSLVNELGNRNRKAVWTYRYPGNKKVLRYSARTSGETRATPLPLSFRESEADELPFEQEAIKRQAFISWFGNLEARSADDRSFADLAIGAAFENAASGELYADELAVLLDDQAEEVARLELARHTMQARGIPARVVNGIYLNESRRRVQIRHWLEYFVDGSDRRYFPDGVPQQFFTIWYGTEQLISSTGVDDLAVQITVQSHESDALSIARNQEGALGDFGRNVSLSSLPLTTQLVYKVLLTIPVGITILVFLRQFIGIRTLGTFMPVLIGIAFRETALVNGLILFTTLVALGLALRFYLERLQLLLVPRLAVVLIFIVIVMSAITVLLTESNQSIGLSISLFPMVILTMTIERMSIVWEEVSASEAIKHGFGSLLVASLTYLVMSQPRIEYLMYQFPELLLVLMGLCVLMGRYTGLRLSEIWRFRAFVG